jgi:hypothetical protein
LRSRLVVVALLCLLAAPAAARADGDPASDYLLGTSAFVPPDANIPSADAQQLRTVLAAAKASGYQIRVALLATSYDMGSVATLFRRPSEYARFLGQELFFVYKGRLLVVMPNGYAVSRGGKLVPSAQRIVNSLPAPGTDGHALATGATAAVRKLAAAGGVNVPLPKLAASAKSNTGDWFLIGIVALVVIAGGGAAVVARRRRT